MPYPYRAAVTALNPVAYWPLDSATAVVGPNLTLVTPPGSGPPLVLGGGASMLFTRADDQEVTTAHQAALEFLNLAPYTIVCWARPSVLVEDNNVYSICNQRDQATGGWSVSESYGTYTNLDYVRDAGGSENDFERAGYFTRDVTSMVTCRFDGSQMWMIRDGGSLINSVAASLNQATNGTQPFFIGCGGTGGGDSGFDGMLAELAIFDYVVTDYDIRNLYAAGVGSMPFVLRPAMVVR